MKPIEIKTFNFVPADLHTHNTFSEKDGSATPEQIAKRLRNFGLIRLVLAITNHNTIEGSTEVFKACRRYGLTANIITGEEVTLVERNPENKRGELIGLFLKETIPAHSTIDQVVAAVREQKGVLVIPHMFEGWRHGIGPEMTKEVIRKSQEAGVPVAVERFNARATPVNNKRADEFVRTWNKKHLTPILVTIGSDAHYWREYGYHRAEMLMRPFTDRDSFLESLAGATPWTTDDNHVKSFIYRTLNKLTVQARKLKGPQYLSI